MGASLGGMKPMHKQADLPIPGITHVMQPHWFNEAEPGESKEDFGLRAARAIEQRILELGPENVGAFIGEPIQGAGGVVIPPSTYWPEVQKICQKYDLLLIADEVICGFGRTGSWFGHQTLGIKPDLVPMAKGMSSGYLPISAVAVSDKITEVLIDKGGEFTHGYTYSGHPAACAVARASLQNSDAYRAAVADREAILARYAESCAADKQNWQARRGERQAAYRQFQQQKRQGSTKGSHENARSDYQTTNAPDRRDGRLTPAMPEFAKKIASPAEAPAPAKTPSVRDYLKSTDIQKEMLRAANKAAQQPEKEAQADKPAEAFKEAATPSPEAKPQQGQIASKGLKL